VRRRVVRRLPLLLAVGAFAWLYGPLLDVAQFPVLRDMLVFHWPLRTEFARQLHAGILPVWNGTINGGQPILSNPNYAAFYPLTWLLAWIPPHAAINLLLFLQGAWAFWGAYRLVRRFGGGTGPASLAAVAFSAGPLFGIYDTVTIFSSWTWFPWILGWSAEAMGLAAATDDGNSAQRPLRFTSLAAFGFALQLFAGDPTSVILTGLAVGCLWVTSPRPHRWRSWRWPALIALLAVLIASVQLWPTLERMRGTNRTLDLTEAIATQWSMPPARYVELLLPRFYGHPTDNSYGLYFGRGIGDLDVPYVPTLYVGQILLLLAIVGFVLWPIRQRWAWLLMAGLGALFALGRFDPLYETLIYRIPPFNLVRYPEKFFLLTAAALVFAGALAWEKLLESRRQGHHARADFPIAVSAVLAVLSATYWSLLEWRPQWFDWLVRPHLFMTLAEEMIARRLEYLQHWALAAIATSVSVILLMVLHRWRRMPERALVILTLLVAILDIGIPMRSVMKRSPVDVLSQAPTVLQRVPKLSGRIYAAALPTSRIPSLSQGRYAAVLGRLQLEQCIPYGATLWGYDYALNPDFDFMLTPWGRHALGAFDHLWTTRRRVATYKVLGAWNVGTVILPTPPGRALEEQREGERPPVALAEHNRFQLPKFRLVQSVTFHDDVRSALHASDAEYYEFPSKEHWVGSVPKDWPKELAGKEEEGLLRVVDGPGRIKIAYAAKRPAAFVAAITYHPGWTARVDGHELQTYPTEIGQIGILLPPGKHTLTLRFWEPAVTWGAALTLVGLVLAGVLWWRGGRRTGGESPRAPHPE